MRNVNMKDVMIRIGYYAVPVMQTIAASVGVILVMRAIDRITRSV